MGEKVQAVVKPAVVQKGQFYRRRPSVDLRVTYPDVKMQGVVKNTVVKLKGIAFKADVGFAHRTCANPVTITSAQMVLLQTAVDNKLAELTVKDKLSASQIGYVNGHMTNHFNDYVTVQ